MPTEKKNITTTNTSLTIGLEQQTLRTTPNDSTKNIPEHQKH